jgi:hypothetical protein
LLRRNAAVGAGSYKIFRHHRYDATVRRQLMFTMSLVKKATRDLSKFVHDFSGPFKERRIKELLDSIGTCLFSLHYRAD